MIDFAYCRRTAWQAVLAMIGMLACGLAAAQGTAGNVHPALRDTWTFQLGAYVPTVETTARLNSTAGAQGTQVSFEDDLGFDDRKAMPNFLASVRLGERWKLEFEYLSLSRSSTRAISRTINWGDNVYAIGTTVSADFDSDIYRFSGGYSFIKDNQRELGVSLGLHATDFKASLAAAGIGGQTGDALAPLPTIGLYGAYAFSPKWLLSGRLDYFSLNYNDYDGSLVNFNAGIDYRFTRHFGAGVGYRYVDYDLTVTKSKFHGGVNYKFSGPMFYVVSSF
jgi:outer membrane protein with beta-barrel domain